MKVHVEPIVKEPIIRRDALASASIGFSIVDIATVAKNIGQ